MTVEVFRAMKVWIVVFWDLTWSMLVDCYNFPGLNTWDSDLRQL
jgi:hypothetical protein